MKVLYVVGSNLTKNTSANMSHNAYVQGLIENDCEVDIIMAKDSWGEQDTALTRWNNVRYFEYKSQSIADKFRKSATKTVFKHRQESDAFIENNQVRKSIKEIIRGVTKKIFYSVFPDDPIYPLEKVWLKSAIKFKQTSVYDLVVSNSSPAASHKLVVLLKEKNRIKFKRWIQIWEDPWYFDLYGGLSNDVRKEEHLLLRTATEIYYVSPLTLRYQKLHFEDCAEKMKHIPLPYLKFTNKSLDICEEDTFGYFGDYYSHTRNLTPFYEALKISGKKGYIYGDSNCSLKETELIKISGRVTLDILEKVQEETSVLVHLCNLHGGQIPGKIYHYSATNKPILFILDGTDDEKLAIKEYFAQFSRYEFCENNIESIADAIERICVNKEKWESVDAFSPKTVVSKLIR